MSLASLVIAATIALPAPADGVAWEKDYEAAFAKAKERNVAVLVAFNMDKEPASESTVSIYQDPAFVARCKDFVCLIGSTPLHTPEGSTDPCPRFGTVTCAEHHQVEIKASAEFVGTDIVISPQHVLISPERKVLLRRAYFTSRDEILKMMKMAEKSVQSGKYAGAAGEAKRIDELLAAAKDRNADKRRPAIQELGRTENLAARDALIALTDPKTMDDTRIEAIQALSSKGNYDALPHVIARLGDTNTLVVRHAIVGLERIGLPPAVVPLLKLWKKKPIAVIAGEIPRALVACGAADPEVAALVKKACRAKESQVEMNAMIALRGLPPDADSRKILGEKLKDSNGNTRGIAVWVIGMARDRTLLPDLEERLEKENNPDVKDVVGLAIRNLQAEDGAKTVQGLDEALQKFVDDELPRT